MAAGEQHTCALFSNGRVACWGGNRAGQLGTGGRDGHLSPHWVPGLADIVEISAGTNHTCALARSGKVHCWGSNSYGEIGNGRTDPVSSVLAPTVVVDLEGARSVRLGSNYSCALLNDGAVKCWGYNDGCLGDGTKTSRTRPVSVGGLTNVLELALGGGNSAARMGDGTIKFWGRKGVAVLGVSKDRHLLVPTAVPGFSGARQLALDGRRLCARMADGKVRCSVDGGGFGYVGLGEAFGSADGPSNVRGITNAKQIAGNSYHFCAIGTGGGVWCWGQNTFGELGDGTTIDRREPVAVRGLTGAVEIVVGFAYHSCARKADGTMFCWGRNLYGALGDNSNVDSNFPTPVLLAPLWSSQ